MTEGIIIFGVVITIACIIWLSQSPKLDDQKKQHELRELADFLGSEVKPLEGFENSYKIDFVYDLKKFTFEYVEDAGINIKQYKGFIRGKTNGNLLLSFTEKEGKTIRSKSKSNAEMATDWAMDDAKVKLPIELKQFKIHTNEPENVARLFANAEILEIFRSLTDEGKRGYPVQALEVLDGVLILKFHPSGNMSPNLRNVWDNSSRIAIYLEKMIKIINKINDIEARRAT